MADTLNYMNLTNTRPGTRQVPVHIHRALLKTLAPHLVALTALTTPENADAILFGSVSEIPFRLDIAADMQGTTLQFNASLDLPGYGSVQTTATATYYKSVIKGFDANGEPQYVGIAWTAKHNIADYLAYDPNATFSIATGLNFNTDRGFEFQLDRNKILHHPVADAVIFAFDLGSNEPGFIDNIIGTPVGLSTGTVAGFGIPQTDTSPQPGYVKGSLGGSTMISTSPFNGGDPSLYVSTFGLNYSLVGLTPGDSGLPLVESFTDPNAPKVILGIGFESSGNGATYTRTDGMAQWSNDFAAAQAQTPEPGTAGLLAAGALGILAKRNRKNDLPPRV